jgi:hypothetical protein
MHMVVVSVGLYVSSSKLLNGFLLNFVLESTPKVVGRISYLVVYVKLKYMVH